MIDLSEFYKTTATLCAVVKKTAEFAAADLEKLEAAYKETSITTKAIQRWLRDKGVIVSDTTIGRHRTGTCPCD